MTAIEAIREIMTRTGWSQTRMAKKLGKNQSVIGTRLKEGGKDISFNNAIEMLDEMGYEVVIQPVGNGRRKDGALVVNGKPSNPPKDGDPK